MLTHAARAAASQRVTALVRSNQSPCSRVFKRQTAHSTVKGLGKFQALEP